METFYFGRLNYIGKYDIYELLTNGNKYRPDSNIIRYGLFSIEVIEDAELGVIFTGELVKYQDLKEEPVVKEDKISIEYIKDVILGKARFFSLRKNTFNCIQPLWQRNKPTGVL